MVDRGVRVGGDRGVVVVVGLVVGSVVDAEVVSQGVVLVVGEVVSHEAAVVVVEVVVSRGAVVVDGAASAGAGTKTAFFSDVVAGGLPRSIYCCCAIPASWMYGSVEDMYPLRPRMSFFALSCTGERALLGRQCYALSCFFAALFRDWNSIQRLFTYAESLVSVPWPLKVMKQSEPHIE